MRITHALGHLCRGRWKLTTAMITAALGIGVAPTLGSAAPASAADYNGDGRADFAVWRPSTGDWFVKVSSGPQSRAPRTGGRRPTFPCLPTITAMAAPTLRSGGPPPATGTSRPTPAPSPTDRITGGPRATSPSLGDYNGDGRADFALFRPSTLEWFLKTYYAGTPVTTRWGLGQADIPVPGDYNGDGRADFTVFVPSDANGNSRWMVYPNRGGLWGTLGDIPVPGDYDGDGLGDFAVWRPVDYTTKDDRRSYWYIKKSSSGDVRAFQWGANGDIPVPGDYNGDGRADFALFRPSSGDWYVKVDSGAPVTGPQNWGAPGDIPGWGRPTAGAGSRTSIGSTSKHQPEGGRST